MEWTYSVIFPSTPEALESFAEQRDVVTDHIKMRIEEHGGRGFIGKPEIYRLDFFRGLQAKGKRTFIMDCFVAFANENARHEVSIYDTDERMATIFDRIAFTGPDETFAEMGFAPENIIYWSYVPSRTLNDGEQDFGLYNFWCTAEEDAVILKLLLS
jgi:hypothetical protein